MYLIFFPLFSQSSPPFLLQHTAQHLPSPRYCTTEFRYHLKPPPDSSHLPDFAGKSTNSGFFLNFLFIEKVRSILFFIEIVSETIVLSARGCFRSEFTPYTFIHYI